MKAEALNKLKQTISSMVSGELGFPVNITYTPVDCDETRLSIASDDFSSYQVPNIFKKLWIESWSPMALDKDEISVSLRYSWEHHDGGTNGSEFLRMWFDNEGILIKATFAKD